MRKVLLATPSHDGRVDVWYANSVINAVRLCQEKDIFLHPVWMSYDALVQRARNDLISLCISEKYDDLIFVDSDMEFDPVWVLSLLDYTEDVVGGTTRKKTDDAEIYVVNTKNLEIEDSGLIKVESLGTGFVKISGKALEDVSKISKEYRNEGKTTKSVCEVKIIQGELCSEDTVLFRKLNKCGYDIWLDPKMTCSHIGSKKYIGNFEDYRERLLSTET